MRPSGLEPPPGLPRTRPSTLRVYQFRHRRSEGEYSRGTYTDRGACRRPQVALQCEHMFVAATIERGVELTWTYQTPAEGLLLHPEVFGRGRLTRPPGGKWQKRGARRILHGA